MEEKEGEGTGRGEVREEGAAEGFKLELQIVFKLEPE